MKPDQALVETLAKAAGMGKLRRDSWMADNGDLGRLCTAYYQAVEDAKPSAITEQILDEATEIYKRGPTAYRLSVKAALDYALKAVRPAVAPLTDEMVTAARQTWACTDGLQQSMRAAIEHADRLRGLKVAEPEVNDPPKIEADFAAALLGNKAIIESLARCIASAIEPSPPSADWHGMAVQMAEAVKDYVEHNQQVSAAKQWLLPLATKILSDANSESFTPTKEAILRLIREEMALRTNQSL